ncbi:nucleoside hydrolase [Bremerella sp. T1]|uniref:nucleoside hydrolase n=1 Tax=Bremerella sp. TYQ1 TaxID=3119568 RepID=UPI001CCD46E1|nr:nucleoside hydrolase [Bremerella volcania]UBM35624.1 nucleoside hydrolase [Bremerella volcania]
MLPRLIVTTFCVLFAASASLAQSSDKPVPLIFDTDIGNDVDDVLALAMIHSLEDMGECQLLAVTITKDHPSAAAFTDAVNTFYGRGDIPIGVCNSGVTDTEGKFLGLANTKDSGKQRFPHDLMSGQDAEDAVKLLRRTLVAAEPKSVVIAQVGFSTNLANLLSSPGDDISPLGGKELAKEKVKFISVMGGAFAKIPGKPGAYGEYNIKMDLAAAQKLSKEWPTPIIWSGYEIGIALPYPHQSIEKDYLYAEHHPLPEAYYLYSPPPHDRPTWDLTSVLYAVRPDAGQFELSPPGTVSINDQSHTSFTPKEDGRDRYLILPDDHKAKIVKTLVDLSKRPPGTN